MLLVAVTISTPSFAEKEVTYPSEKFKLLDTFEAHVLNKADKVFGLKKFRLAAKSYDSVILEFPKSKAIPYALLRKGRCLQLDNKRFDAIKEYREVLDYFPDDVSYAAPALYYTGVCHQRNGDIDKALKAWAEMAADVEYRKHYLAAPALKFLADAMMKQKKVEDAVKYYRMVFLNFRGHSDHTLLRLAVGEVIQHYVRRKPNEAALREFYTEARGFHYTTIRSPMPADVANDRYYWRDVLVQVHQRAYFNQFQKSDRKRYFQHFYKAMAGKFPDDDSFQLDRAWFKRQFDGNTKAWYQQVDKIFEMNAGKGDFNRRIIKWIGLYKGHRDKIKEYIRKTKWDKMDTPLTFELFFGLCKVGETGLAKHDCYSHFKLNEFGNNEIYALMKGLYDKAGDAAMGRNMFGRFRFGEMSDSFKVGVAHYLWSRHEGQVLIILNHLKDQELADAERLRYFHYKMNTKRGIPMGKKVVRIATYAQEAWLKLADMHEHLNQWREAINALRQSDNPPETLFRIATHFVRLGQVPNAVAQLREVENFFKNVAPRAALAIADVYKAAGKKSEEIATLRGIMKKYKGSSQSNTAHERLEAMGIKIGGGLDAK